MWSRSAANLRFEPTGLPSVGLRLKRGSLGRRTKGLAGMVIPASLAGSGGERCSRPFPLAGGGGRVIPGPESEGRAGLVRAEGFGAGIADRPVVGGWSALESAGRERGARSGRGRCSLARGGKEAGGCPGSGRCGKGAPVGWLAIQKRCVPFGERPSMQVGAGGVVGGGAGDGDRQAVGTLALRVDVPGGGKPAGGG